MSTSPRYDPAGLESPKSPCCVCKEHPAHQSPDLKEMNYLKAREARIEDCVYAAIQVFHGDKVCYTVRQWLDEEETPDQGPEMFKSKYGDYELQPKIIEYTNEVTGERYELCQVTLVGSASESDLKYYKLVIGEACSTAAAAVESVEQTLHMIKTYEYNEDIVIESIPVIARLYSWNKCSVCYNTRREPVEEQPQASC